MDSLQGGISRLYNKLTNSFSKRKENVEEKPSEKIFDIGRIVSSFRDSAYVSSVGRKISGAVDRALEQSFLNVSFIGRKSAESRNVSTDYSKEVEKSRKDEGSPSGEQPNVSNKGDIKRSQNVVVQALKEHVSAKKETETAGVETSTFSIGNKTFEVNEFKANSYNGPKSADFTLRQELMFEAAKKCLPENSRSDYLLKQLREHYKMPEFDSQIMEKAFSGNEADVQEAEKHYKEVYAEATRRFGQCASDLVALINHEVPPGKNERKFTLSDLQKLEAEVVLKEGRPTVINIYTVNGKRYFSMQEPLSENTIPTLIRNQPGLVNAVISSFGTLDENDVPTIKMQGDRYCTLPPIAIEDPIQRQAMATRNAKEVIANQAARLYSEEDLNKSTEDQPLEVPMHTMMMLTPKFLDSVRNRQNFIMGKWKGESETMQLEESALAINTINNRPIQVKIGDAEVWVKPSWNYMNLGVNAPAAGVGIGGMIPTADIQNKVNVRGFHTFQKEANEKLMNFYQTLENNRSDAAKNFTAVYEEYLSLSESPEIKKAEENLRGIEEKHKAQLLQAYKKLDFFQTSLEEGFANTRQEITKLKKEIASMEREISNAYKKLNEAKVKNYRAKAEQFETLKDDVNFYNQESQENYEPSINKDYQAPSEAKRMFEILSNLLSSEDLFFMNKYMKKESVMDLPTRYIQMQNLQNNSVTFHCKSAKDRTGRINNVLEEQEIYRNENHRYPIEPKERSHIDREIAPHVAQYSASVNNARYNTRNAGLQIGSKVNPKTLPIRMTKSHAMISKTGFKKSKKLKPSEFVTRLFQEASE